VSPDTRELRTGQIIRAAVVGVIWTESAKQIAGDQVRLSVPVDEHGGPGLSGCRNRGCRATISSSPPHKTRGVVFATFQIGKLVVKMPTYPLQTTCLAVIAGTPALAAVFVALRLYTRRKLNLRLGLGG
jgi:hypothetical protein